MMQTEGREEKSDMKKTAFALAAAALVSLAASGGREPRLGVGMECLDRNLWDHAPAMAGLKELGIKRVRLQTGWARTEKEKGRYDFEWLDKVVSDLESIGVTPWMSLSYGNPLYAAPEEGEQDYTGQKMFPMRSEAGKAAWKAYVTAIVKRYGRRVCAWEIWNEPDVKFFLKVPEGSSWAKEYAEFVRFTSGIVKSVQPDAVVAACTACGPGANGTVELFSQGIADSVDVYSFHAYTAIPEQMTPAVGKAFYSAVRRRAPNIRFWRGEAGISSVKSGFGALSELPLSEEMQARWMSRHLVRDMADPDISFTSWFHLSSFEHFTHTRTYHYGVLRDGDFSPKPSFFVLKRIREFFDDGRCEPDSSACLVLRPAGKGVSHAGQALAAGASVYGFRRNGLPMFAFTSSWPADEAMEPVDVEASLFTGDMSAWREPVVFDLVDGSVARPSPNGAKLRLKLENHVKIVAEAAALAPYVEAKLPAAAPATPAHSAQNDHE